MVSLITDKLGRQTLQDVDREPLLPESSAAELITVSPSALCQESGCVAGCESSRRRSSGDRPGDDGHDRCQQVCCALCRQSCRALSGSDLPPKKRHRHSMPAASSTDHETSAPLLDSSGTAAEWRPALRCTSVWRPVGPKSTSKPLHHRILASSCASSQQQQQHLPQLSPGLARYAFVSERSTPSESPSPRPASASSGFFDSSQGSLNCAIIDGIPTALTTAFSFQFSLHDHLSEEATATSSVGCLSGVSTASSGSMPMISEVSTQTPPSSPFSSQGIPPVRCRSQPTVLVRNRRDRSRASWKKHRRSMFEDDRPKLDFLKMTETAYDKVSRTRMRNSHHVQFAADATTLTNDIEKRSHRDSFRFTQNLSFSATCEGSIPDHEAVCSSRCINSASEDEEPSFECRQTASDSVSDIGDEPLEIAASPSLFHEGEDGIEEEEQEVFGRGLDNEIDIEQIEMH